MGEPWRKRCKITFNLRGDFLGKGGCGKEVAKQSWHRGAYASRAGWTGKRKQRTARQTGFENKQDSEAWA